MNIASHKTKHKFQLIHPFASNTLHYASSHISGAKKCMSELIHHDIINGNLFVILNIDTNETFTFTFNNNKNNNKNNNSNNHDLYNKLHLLTQRVDIIENTLNHNIPSNAQSKQHIDLFDDIPDTKLFEANTYKKHNKRRYSNSLITSFSDNKSLDIHRDISEKYAHNTYTDDIDDIDNIDDYNGCVIV
jgi:hypothetical protein